MRRQTAYLLGCYWERGEGLAPRLLLAQVLSRCVVLMISISRDAPASFLLCIKATAQYEGRVLGLSAEFALFTKRGGYVITWN